MIKDFEIIPQIGYGPIKFGMTPDDASEVLGPPCKMQFALSGGETDEDEVKYQKSIHYMWYGESFPEGANIQITYQEGSAVLISVSKDFGPMKYNGMDLHKKKNREEVLEALAATEDVYYYDEQSYFFPKSGLVVPTPKHMKRFFFIQLVLTDYMMPRLEYEMYEPSTDLN